jgi:hypothetical protein
VVEEGECCLTLVGVHGRPRQTRQVRHP